MRRNRLKVEKTKLCVNIPTELLNECDLYMENYSKYFTRCLESFLLNAKKKAFEKESTDTDIIQSKRTYSSICSHECSTLEQEEEEYQTLLAEFKKLKAERR